MISKILHKLSPSKFIILILIAATITRLAALNIRQSMFTSNSARDVLRTQQLVKFHLAPYPPYCAGCNHFLPSNSPIYYYFLSIGYYFTSNELGIHLLLTLCSLALVWLLYQIGNIFFNRTTAITAACIAAVSYRLIWQNTYVFQPAIIPTLSTLLILLLLKAYYQKSTVYLSLFYFVLCFSLHIHYSILTIVPILFVWSLYVYHKIFQKKASLIPAIVFIDSLFIWYFIITRYPYSSVNYSKKLSFIPFDQLISGINSTISSLFSFGISNFSNPTLLAPNTLTFIIALIIFSTALIIISKKSFNKNFSYLVTFSLLLGIIPTALFSDFSYHQYDNPLIPIYILSFSIFFSLVVDQSISSRKHFLVYLGLTFLVFFRSFQYYHSLRQYPSSNSINEMIYQKIIQFHNDHDLQQNFVVLGRGDGNSDTLGPANFYYYLQEKYSGKISEPYPSDWFIFDVKNFPQTSTAKYYYLVCNDILNNWTQFSNDCLSNLPTNLSQLQPVLKFTTSNPPSGEFLIYRLENSLYKSD